jgi:hypothetical protein
VVGAITAVYAAVGATAAFLARSEYLSVSVVRAVAGTALLAACAASVGVLRVPEVRAALVDRLDPRAVEVLRGGAIAAAGALGAGALAAGLCVVLSVDHAAELVRALGAGPVGTAGVLLLCLVYTPTAAVWGAAYLVGPGFAVGAGTAVVATGVDLGPLPAMPLLAALPVGPASGATLALFLLPVAAAVLAGVRVSRTGPRSWRGVLLAAASTGPVAGVLLGLGALVAGGPLGDGRLGAVGPSGWQVALAATALVAAAAVAGAAAHRGLRHAKAAR